MLRLAVLGDPVAHSRSPAIHGAALDAAGLTGTYEARRVDEAGMRAAVAEVRAGRLDGANVTMPHKRLAAELCDDLTDLARRAGSVNTLIPVAGRVLGETTDVAGIREAWGPLPIGPVLVLGAGGAAAAALLALEDRAIHVSARRQAAAERLVARLGVDASVLRWGRAVAGAVVVNATPIGMAGEVLPGRVLDAASGLFDMPYGSEPTPAIKAVDSRGLPTVPGSEMLLFQAAASWRLWTGGEAPLSAMRAALR